MPALAVAGGKGGAGKTTSTLGLGTALRRQGRRPLAVDADADMPNLAAVAETPDAPGVGALADGAPLSAVSHLGRRCPGVEVVPARAGAPVERALPELPTGRPVLLDCPGGAGPDAAAPLRVADGAVVVTAPTATAAADAQKTAAMARSLDAPVRAVAVVGAADVPESVAARFDAPAVAVPRVDRPVLRDDGVRAAYARLATAAIDSSR